ncbi:MAG: HAD-IC family P-type ATPase, partial [Nanoarchaeota archaeon]
TVHAKGNQRIAYTKGAPDVILALCDRILIGGRVRALTPLDRNEVMRANDAMAVSAMRVLGFAYRQLGPKEHAGEHVEHGLIFVGLQGMIDPPRDEAGEAVATAQQAGIRVLMITGDHPLTAGAIAKELGIVGEMMNGQQIDKIKDLSKVIERVGVFARVDPAHKLRIIEALRKKGHIVAMTGDGVNDAPALKSADIGIAMGRSGTDVAREASDMVLADDNFATIVAAIRGGRAIFDNIIKFVTYMLSANLGEVLTIFGGILLGFPLPLTAVMLLWVNLVTDGLPAIALTLERPEPGIMTRKPRPVDEGLLTRRRALRICIVGIGIALATLLAFWWRLGSGVEKAQTMAFATIVVMEMARVFSQRSESMTTPQLGWLTNQWLIGAVACSVLLQVLAVQWGPLQHVFGTVGLSWLEWGVALALALGMFVLSQTLILFKPTRE